MKNIFKTKWLWGLLLLTLIAGGVISQNASQCNRRMEANKFWCFNFSPKGTKNNLGAKLDQEERVLLFDRFYEIKNTGNKKRFVPTKSPASWNRAVCAAGDGENVDGLVYDPERQNTTGRIDPVSGKNVPICADYNDPTDAESAFRFYDRAGRERDAQIEVDIYEVRDNPIANGVQFQKFNAFNDGKWATLSLSCESGYHAENSLCAPDTRSCIVPNGSGFQSWNGSDYGTCETAYCVSGFHKENNACVPNTRSCVVSNGTGTQSWQGTSYGTCTVISCNSGYVQSGNECITQPSRDQAEADAQNSGCGLDQYLGTTPSSSGSCLRDNRSDIPGTCTGQSTNYGPNGTYCPDFSYNADTCENNGCVWQSDVISCSGLSSSSSCNSKSGCIWQPSGSTTSCTSVGTGFYSPNDDDNRYSCTNKPGNSYFTSAGNGINDCNWNCNYGYVQSAGSCVMPSSGGSSGGGGNGGTGSSSYSSLLLKQNIQPLKGSLEKIMEYAQ